MEGAITLIGGGLAGPLLAIYLARRGFSVDVYERRPDLRKGRRDGGRSINLALSTRGIHALRDVGLAESVLELAIPMRGRMIHSRAGDLAFQPYGRDDREVIYAVSRGELNVALLDAAEKLPGVRFHFQQKCTGVNPETGDVTLHDLAAGREHVRRCPIVIGTDGSASAVRSALEHTWRFQLSQEHLDYGYKELSIPAGPGGAFRLEKNALHIWPRGAYMLIALPNLDGSFTCTFFFPFEGTPSFDSLRTREQVGAFFAEQFPDALDRMPALLDDYFANPLGAMVTIKCRPWHSGGRVLLLGDAAHAIVPFFGQGMNCAFEDCTVLDDCLAQRIPAGGPAAADWDAVFRAFEAERKANTDAIADLAVENFVEMRDYVGQAKFLLKKKVEAALQERFPDQFIPKYSMVTFHRIPYAVALAKGKLQDRILDRLCARIDRVEDVDWAEAERLVAEGASGEGQG